MVTRLSLGGRRGGMGQRTRSRDHLVQEFVPSSAWTEDSVGHYLLVDLPGISDGSTADDIVEENPSRDENLKENTETPGDGHQHTGNKVKTSNYLDGLHRVILDKWGQEESPYLDLAMAMIKNNKGILITAVVAFSIGVLVSRSRYESAGE